MIFSSDLYLAFALAVLFLPLPAISVWFHRRIVRTPGGRRLMRAQRQAGRVNISLNAPASLRDGLRIFKDLRAGKYGQDARHVMRRTWQLLALWLAACVLVLAPLILTRP